MSNRFRHHLLATLAAPALCFSLVDSLVSRGVSPTLINVMYPDAPFYRAATVKKEEDQISLNSGQ